MPSQGGLEKALRSGQHSFALFKHPYEWGGGANWIKLATGAITNTETKQEYSPELSYTQVHSLLPLNSSDPSIPYKQAGWNYGVFVCPEDATRLFSPVTTPNGSVSRLVEQGSVSFVPGAPGVADLPEGSDLPSRMRPIFRPEQASDGKRPCPSPAIP